MDKRKNARVGLNSVQGEIVKLQVMDSPYYEYLLNYLALMEDCKDITNICCGSSNFGTHRYDTNPKANITELGNLFELVKTLPKKSTDLLCLWTLLLKVCSFQEFLHL